jgi:hypothetical protein
MKVRLKYNSVDIEADGDTHKDVFRQLAALSEVFRGELCGNCHKDNSLLRVRKVDDPKSKGKKQFEYFERQCLTKDCRHRLAYGQHNEGGSLFPKRKGDDGQLLPKNGWFTFEKNTKENAGK